MGLSENSSTTGAATNKHGGSNGYSGGGYEFENVECKKGYESDDDWSYCPKKSGDSWRWVVVLGAFCNIFLVDGVCFSFGIVVPEYMQKFQASQPEVGWVGSTLAGSYLLVGPIVSALCERYGCRKITIIGSCISCAGFFMSYFSTSIEMLTVTYGLIGGIGFGMMYLPSIVCVGYWFESGGRALATGIAVCGSGVGQFVFPPLIEYLLRKYTWEGKNMIMAGFVLHGAVFGALFRPVKNLVTKPREAQNPVQIERGNIMKSLIEEKKRQRTISNGSLDNCIITKDNRLIKLDPSLLEMKRNNSFIARFKKQLGFSSNSLASSKNSLQNQGIPSIVIDALQQHTKSSNSPIFRPNGRVKQNSESGIVLKRGSSPDGVHFPNGRSIQSLTVTPSNGFLPKTHSDNELMKLESSAQSSEHGSSGMSVVSRSASDLPSSPVDGSVISIQVLPACNPGSTRCRSCRSLSSECSSQQTPMIITSTSGSVSYSTAYIEEMDEEPEIIFVKIFRVFIGMFALNYLANSVFALLALSMTLTLLVFYIPWFYIPIKNADMGFDPEAGSFLLSIVGVTNAVGRILAGWLADRPCVNLLYLNNFSLIVAGIAVLLIPICNTYSLLATVAALFGLCFAFFITLRAVLLVDLLGIEKLNKSFGLLTLFEGLAAFAGPPLAGELNKNFGSTDPGFYLAGLMIIISAFILMPVKCLKDRQLRKRLQLEPEEEPMHKTDV